MGGARVGVSVGGARVGVSVGGARVHRLLHVVSASQHALGKCGRRHKSLYAAEDDPASGIRGPVSALAKRFEMFC